MAPSPRTPRPVNELAETDAPWADGEEHDVIDSLLFDAVAAGADRGRPHDHQLGAVQGADSASGKIAPMALGSWAIPQMQDAARRRRRTRRHRLHAVPRPGRRRVPLGDRPATTRTASTSTPRHKAAARGWVDWFADESGYATDQGGLSPRLDGPTPAHARGLRRLPACSTSSSPGAAAGEPVNDIDKEAEIGLLEPRLPPAHRRRGARRVGRDQAADLRRPGRQWAAARASVAADAVHWPSRHGPRPGGRPDHVGRSPACRIPIRQDSMLRIHPGDRPRVRRRPPQLRGRSCSSGSRSLLVTFTYVPVANMFWYSFTDWNGISKTKDYIGLDNYIDFFTRPELFRVFFVSASTTSASFVQMALALYFATISELQHPVQEPLQGGPVLPVPHQRRRHRRSRSCTSSGPAARSTRRSRPSA